MTKLLPESNGEFEYRIKSERELTERVARESQLIVFQSRRSVGVLARGAILPARGGSLARWGGFATKNGGSLAGNVCSNASSMRSSSFVCALPM